MSDTPLARVLQHALQQQYDAALRMLRIAVERCPDELWDNRGGGEAPFWQQAMHTVFYTRLYLCPSEQHADVARNLGTAGEQIGVPLLDTSDEGCRRVFMAVWSLTAESSTPPRVVTREEMLGRIRLIEEAVPGAVLRVCGPDADGPSPMSWMTRSPLELLLYNLRHVQHHIGRLYSLLGRAGLRLDWH